MKEQIYEFLGLDAVEVQHEETPDGKHYITHKDGTRQRVSKYNVCSFKTQGFHFGYVVINSVVHYWGAMKLVPDQVRRCGGKWTPEEIEYIRKACAELSTQYGHGRQVEMYEDIAAMYEQEHGRPISADSVGGIRNCNLARNIYTRYDEGRK